MTSIVNIYNPDSSNMQNYACVIINYCNKMAINHDMQEDDDLIVVQDDAKHYKDYGYEDYGHKDYNNLNSDKDYNNLDGDRENSRRKMSNTEIVEADSDYQEVEKQLSQQDENV